MIRNLIREDRIINESIDKFLESVILTESTLSQLIGNTPEGQKLMKWLHRVDRLSNFAEYGLLTRKTERVQWEAFKSNPDHFVIIKGPTTAMAIKPNEESFNALRDQAEKAGEPFNPDKSKSLVYDFVGFSREGDRIDSSIGEPEKFPHYKNFGITSSDVKAFDKNPNLLNPTVREKAKKYHDAVQKTKQELYSKKLPLDAPSTKLSSTRGGKPFSSDLDRAPHAMFDQIRDFMGGNFDVYIVSSKVSDFPGKTQGMKKARKEFALGHKPREIPKGRGIIQGAFDDPGVGRRSYGGIEREKIASRGKSLFDDVISRLKPLLSIFIDRANSVIAARRKEAVNSKSQDELKKYQAIANKIDDFEMSLKVGHKFKLSDQEDMTVNVVSNAIRQVSGINDLSSKEGQEYLNNLLAPNSMANLKSILQVVYQQLVNG